MYIHKSSKNIPSCHYHQDRAIAIRPMSDHWSAPAPIGQLQYHVASKRDFWPADFIRAHK